MGQKNRSSRRNDNSSVNSSSSSRNKISDGRDDFSELKLHHRSWRESFLIFLFVKPHHQSYHYLVRVLLFVVAAIYSLSLAIRLHTSSQTFFLENSNKHENHRVLFQPPSILTMTSATNSYLKKLQKQEKRAWSVAGYAPRPRVVGYYWPHDYDDIEEDDYDKSTAIDKTTTTDKTVPLQFEQIDPNLIRPLTDRSIYVSKEAFKAQLHLQNSKENDEERRDPFEEGDCQAQFDWQKLSYPTCNELHQQALHDMFAPQGQRINFLTYGYWRDVWMVRDVDWDPLALKTIRYEHEVGLWCAYLLACGIECCGHHLTLIFPFFVPVQYVDRNYDRHR